MRILIILLILLALMLPVSAQGGRVMDCTGAGELYYTRDGVALGNRVSESTLQQLYSLSGDEFFDEANYRWEWANDVQLIAFMVENEPLDTRAMVTVYQSPTQPEWVYIITYNTSRQNTDAYGNHLGNHPCNNIRIPDGSIAFGSAPTQSQHTAQSRRNNTTREDVQLANWCQGATAHTLSDEAYSRYCE